MKGSKSTSKFEISYSKKFHKRIRRSRHYPSSNIIHVQVKSQNNIPTISKILQSSSSSSQRIIYNQNSLSSLKAVELLNNKNVTNNYHRVLQTKKNKKHSRRRMVSSLIIGFLLMIILVATILIILLTKTNQTKTINRNKPALLRWNSEGVTVAGMNSTYGSAVNLLYYPFDLVIDWSYSLFVADRANNRIQKFLRGSSNATTVAGRADGVADSTNTTLKEPTSLLVDNDDNIHISDVNNNRVMFWKKDAVQGTIVVGNGVSGSSNDQLMNPIGLAYDYRSNSLFIADYGNSRVMKYLYNSSTGIRVVGNNTCGTSTIQLCQPHGLFFEQSSNSLLIANAGAYNIVRWTLNDTQWSIVVGNSGGTSGISPSTFGYPTDVMLDPMGNIYVADRFNHRVQFFMTGQSNATTIAGKTGMAGSSATLLSSPNAMTFDNQLNLYVADWHNHRIQKFSRY